MCIKIQLTWILGHLCDECLDHDAAVWLIQFYQRLHAIAIDFSWGNMEEQAGGYRWESSGGIHVVVMLVCMALKWSFQKGEFITADRTKQFITMTSKWAQLHLKSPALQLFTQPLIQVQIKGNIKAPCHWPLCREFTGDQWIPHTNGQLHGKCFHLMTSSCIQHLQLHILCGAL